MTRCKEAHNRALVVVSYKKNSTHVLTQEASAQTASFCIRS